MARKKVFRPANADMSRPAIFDTLPAAQAAPPGPGTTDVVADGVAVVAGGTQVAASS